jgi:hypothetical protein
MAVERAADRIRRRGSLALLFPRLPNVGERPQNGGRVLILALREKTTLHVLAAQYNCRIHSRGAPYGYATRQCGDASKEQ